MNFRIVYVCVVTIITIEDRQSNDVFVPVKIVAGCVGNSDHIDGTGILRSTLAIDRKSKFIIDINLSTLPQLTQNNTQSAIDFLRYADYYHRFSSPNFEDIN